MDHWIIHSFLGRGSSQTLPRGTKPEHPCHTAMDITQGDAMAEELDPQILQLIKHKVPPNYLVIHLGSNYLVTPNLTSKKFIQVIQCSFLRYNALLPNTKLVWSHILPRRYWHRAQLNTWQKRYTRNVKEKYLKIYHICGWGCNFICKHIRCQSGLVKIWW